MAKLVFGMMQSLDGYIAAADGGLNMPRPDDALHQHFNDTVRASVAIIYGRRMYEIMRYWDGEEAEEGEAGLAFATAWRAKPKWVVSRTLKSVGPNATLLSGDLETSIKALKAEHEGVIDVAGPELAGGLSALGLIDEYQLYLRPFVLGRGKPFFHGPRPPLRLKSSEQIGDTMRLVYVPA